MVPSVIVWFTSGESCALILKVLLLLNQLFLSCWACYCGGPGYLSAPPSGSGIPTPPSWTAVCERSSSLPVLRAGGPLLPEPAAGLKVVHRWQLQYKMVELNPLSVTKYLGIQFFAEESLTNGIVYSPQIESKSVGKHWNVLHLLLYLWLRT